MKITFHFWIKHILFMMYYFFNTVRFSIRMFTCTHIEMAFFPHVLSLSIWQWSWAAYLFVLSYNRDYLFFEYLAKGKIKPSGPRDFFKEEIFDNCFNVFDGSFFIQVVYFSCLNLGFSYFSRYLPTLSKLSNILY